MEPYPCSDAFFLQIQSKSSNGDKITQRFNTFSPAAKLHQKISVIEHSKKKRLKAHFWVQILLNESLAYSL
jgi:hypothetical protein